MSAREHDFVVASVNYSKARIPGQVKHLDTGLRQGGDFMTNTQKGSKKALAKLDPRDVRIYDARPNSHIYEMDKHGFQIATDFQTSLPETLDVLFEEREQQIRAIYWPEVCALAKTNIKSDGRPPRYVFALGTQKFTEDKSRGLLGSYSRSAHADFSDVVFDRALKMLTKRGVNEVEAKTLDLMFVNAWRPFGKVVEDNPLTILDWTTVDPSSDVHGVKRGAKVTKGNIITTTVTYNENHKWVYIPQMLPEEVWLFKQADSRSSNPDGSPNAPPSLARHAFHTSFRQPGHGSQDRTRRSIAVRLLCAFEPNSAKPRL